MISSPILKCSLNWYRNVKCDFNAGSQVFYAISTNKSRLKVSRIIFIQPSSNPIGTSTFVDKNSHTTDRLTRRYTFSSEKVTMLLMTNAYVLYFSYGNVPAFFLYLSSKLANMVLIRGLGSYK